MKRHVLLGIVLALIAVMCFYAAAERYHTKQEEVRAYLEQHLNSAIRANELLRDHPAPAPFTVYGATAFGVFLLAASAASFSAGSYR